MSDHAAAMPGSVRRLGSTHLVRRSDLDAAFALLAVGQAGSLGAATPGGLVVRGGPGIGKSALAHRVLERLHDDGWAVAAVIGRWYPSSLFTNVAEALETCRRDFPRRREALESLSGPESHGSMFETILGLLESAPLALVFDDLGPNLGSWGYLDPGFGEALGRICHSAGTGRVLVTSREAPPRSAELDRLSDLLLSPPDAVAAEELATSLPVLSTLDATARQQVVAAVAGHPRSLQLADAWLGARGGQPAKRLAALLSLTRPALLDLVLAELTAKERGLLLQAALATFPLTVRDLAAACDDRNPSIEQRQTPARAALDAAAVGVARLTELGLLTAWHGVEERETVLSVDRWIAEELAPHQGERLAERHERTMNMHYAETHSDRRNLDDYVGVTRHLAAVNDGTGDLTHYTIGVVDGREPDYSTQALLGEVAPVVPAGDGHYLPIRERQITTLIANGFLTAARDVGERTLRAVKPWSATHTERDPARFCLGKAHNMYGVALLRAGDLLAAESIFKTTIDIYHELAEEHPTLVEAQQRLGVALGHLSEVYEELERPEDEEARYQTYVECVFVWTQLFEASPNPEVALAASHAYQRLALFARRDGDLDNARSLLNSRLMMLEAMSAAHPDNVELLTELITAHTALALVAEA